MQELVSSTRIPGHPGVGVINQDLVSPTLLVGTLGTFSWIGLMLDSQDANTWLSISSTVVAGVLGVDMGGIWLLG